MTKNIHKFEDIVIDDGDFRILRILQEDGRITNQALAKRCGMAPATAFERTRRLRSNGIIKDIVAILNPVAMNRALLIFVEVQLDRTDVSVFTAFAEHMRSIDAIVECHMVAGNFDYLLKVRVPDIAAYRTFLGETLSAIPGLRGTRTYAVLEEVKATTRLAI